MRSDTRTWIAFFAIATAHLCQAQAANIVNMGVTSNWISSTATGVSADGSIVVGNDIDTSINSTTMPFIWNSNTNSRIQLSGPINSGFTGISADGTKAVGFFQTGGITSNGGPFIYDVATGTPSYMSATATGGVMNAVPTGISADGTTISANLYTLNGYQVAGSGPYGGPLAMMPYLAEGHANAVSADGSVIVGDMGNAFRFTQGTYTFLGNINPVTRALSVSGDGSVVVGSSESYDSNYSRSFIWTDANGLVDLNIPSAKSSAIDISDDGFVIVGKTFDGSTGDHAYLYDRSAGQYYDLLSLLNTNGVTGSGSWSQIYTANSISGNSSSGYNIVGQGLIGGDRRAFLIKGLTLTSVPEPSGFALAAFATGIFAFTARRRKHHKS